MSRRTGSTVQVRAERRAAVVAQSLCGTATGYAQLILQPSSLDNSADEIVHSWLGARSSRHSGRLLLLSPLRPPLFLSGTDSGDCGG